MHLRIFLTVASITFIAELPDKTSLASFVMSTRRRPLAVFAGGATAMVIHSAIAVALGSLLDLFPKEPLRVFTGAAFLVFAFFMWRSTDHEDSELSRSEQESKSFLGIAAEAMAVIFVAEWGDLTQFSTAALAAKYHEPWTVLPAAILGLWAAIGLAGWLGSKIGGVFAARTLKKFASAMFAVIGLWTLFS